MNSYYIDIPIIIIIVFSFIYGFKKGIIGFITPVVSIIVTFLLFPFINIFLSNLIAQYNTNIFFKILSFILIYVILRIIFEKTKDLLEQILKVIFLDWLNKVAGGLFMSLIFMFIIWLIYALLAFVIPDNPLQLNSIILNNITNVIFTYFDIYKIL